MYGAGGLSRKRMPKILIIKLSALGDVVRTTPLLRVLEADVTWVTCEKSCPLLVGNPFISRLCCIKRLPDSIFEESFDSVINLEDELAPARLATRLRKGALMGAYFGDSGITYTDAAREWFDLSLISKLGKSRADELKMQNRRTYQDFLFSMTGHRFEGEEYVLNTKLTRAPVAKLVGLESRAGEVWPAKRWTGYDELAKRLEGEGFTFTTFRQRETLDDYINDVNECEFVVCGDTLAMHIALALKKKVVSIFTCTSPHEIYDYGRMKKVVSPLWEKFFYRRDFLPEAAAAIPVDAVIETMFSWEGTPLNHSLTACQQPAEP